MPTEVPAGMFQLSASQIHDIEFIGGVPNSPSSSSSQDTAVTTARGAVDCVIANRYIVTKPAGEGSHGAVKFAIDVETDTQVVLKLVPRMPRHLAAAVGADQSNPPSEIDILASVTGHPNVCPMLHNLVTESHHVIVMEAHAVDLFSYMETNCETVIPPVHIKRLMRDVLQGLEYCHSLGVAHRDIKPENILLTSDNIENAAAKLCDFDLATTKPTSRAMCGSSMYTAPEVLLQGSTRDALPYTSLPVDIWSAGVVLYSVWTSFSPWAVAVRADPVFDRYCMVRSDFWDWSCAHSGDLITPEFLSLFSGMCDLNPAERLTAQQCLDHPFFHDV